MRLAVLPDYPAEGWPSMDLCAAMLLAHTPAARCVPPFARVFSRLPHPAGFNADRLLNRHVLYPQFARRLSGRFDCFHVVDHSYAQLILSLPAGRTGVYCHDLDAFRCLFDPAADRRPRWFRALARRTLRGLQRAAVIFAISNATRDGLIAHGLADPSRVRVVPLGVAPEYSPTDERRGLSPPNPPIILHVGSCIPRKRIDTLLAVTAAVRESIPDVRLLKVGGQWTPAQREQIARLHLSPAIDHRTDLTRGEVADAYRSASVVLVPSESEGFGLPVVEALACGVPVVASDLPVLREVGGDAVSYAPVADVPAWAKSVVEALAGMGPDRATRLARASRFRWSTHAATVTAAYRELVSARLTPPSATGSPGR